jgi:hypothetical protein
MIGVDESKITAIERAMQTKLISLMDIDSSLESEMVT